MMYAEHKPETADYGAWCRARREWEAKRDEQPKKEETQMITVSTAYIRVTFDTTGGV